MYHGLPIRVKWPKMRLESIVLSPANGLLLLSSIPPTRYAQDAAFLCCRQSGRKVGINLLDLLDYYRNEDTCRDYLEQLRWPNGVACPRCGSMRVSPVTTRNKFDCLDCKYAFSVTSQTALHATRIPLRKWIVATFMICVAKKGVSSIQLAKELGLTQRSAWYLGHRIRRALWQSIAPIQRVVEVDETWIGKVGQKVMVVGIVERGGQIILEVKDDRSKETLHGFILDHVDREYATIFTDDWRGYWGLPNHHTITHSKKEWVREGQIHTNAIEGFWSLLKRSISGTFHHVSIKHLPPLPERIGMEVQQSRT